jgi:PAS domain S-box-containing protein
MNSDDSILNRGGEPVAAELLGSESTAPQSLSHGERAEVALRQSEERYRELVENANDVIYTLDFEGNITSINNAGELISGYTREELLKMNLAEFLTPDSIASGRQMLDRKLVGEARTNYEVDARAKDGRLVTLEISSRLVFKDGEAVGIEGIARDISERRRAEEALREADQRALDEYERLLERISSLAQALGTARELLAIYRGLRDFTMVSVPCDGLFVSLYDPERQERIACYGWGDGQEIDVSALPPMPITAQGPNSRAVRTGQIIITDDYMNATRGHPGVVIGPENGLRPQCSLAVPMSVMGRIVGTIEVQSYQRAAYKQEHVAAMRMAANLTAVAIENVRLLERESSARAAAEESNRLKDEFLATVSHEVRTPLTAILGWSRMLEAGGLDAQTTAKAIETIRRNAKSQSQIIDDILDVSRIITGNLHLDLTPTELAPVVEAAINVVRPTAEAKRIQIESAFASQLTLVSGDSNRLQQVVWNLLSNAVKFTPAGGRVQITAGQTGAHAEIKVSDNGQGISPDFLPFVFDRFRQADSTTTRRHGGLGLGLAIVRHLVEIHGGTVSAGSDGEGKGATFTVRLPIVSSVTGGRNYERMEASSVTSLAESTPVLSGLHVLLVDDDPDSLELITAALASRQARVTSVLSSDEAIERIKESMPDIIVSDIAMPGEDGYALMRKVRSLGSDHARMIPAVAITAYAREEDRERALASGFQDYLPKPIEPSELIRVVALAAGNRGPIANRI